MKKQIILLLLITVAFGCTKEDGNNSNCTGLKAVNNWTKTDFKSNYTIQIPNGFEGPGMVGFEGNTFYKNSADNEIILYYTYCNPLWCADFGDTLKSEFPASVQTMGFYDIIIDLDQSAYFCQNSEIQGILYYRNDEITKGRLYWKDNDVYKQTLELEFNLSKIDTVIKIIGTITEK